jgi:predicted transcriptional regulator YdeE
MCHQALTAAPQGLPPQETAEARPEAKAETKTEIRAETKFEPRVVQLPAMTLVGLSVRTHMDERDADSQALWRAFSPRINEIAIDPNDPNGPKEVFGFSVPLDLGDDIGPVDGEWFDYWATAEAKLPPKGPLPARMKRFDVPAGTYVVCHAPSAERRGETWDAYYEWERANAGYERDDSDSRRPLELYPHPWRPGMAHDLYVPVKKEPKKKKTGR